MHPSLNNSVYGAENLDVKGYWIGVDENDIPISVNAIYVHNDKLFGRIVAIFKEGKVIDSVENPKGRTKAYPGNPFICGFDYIFNLAFSDGKWKGGKITDIKAGHYYNCKIWREGQDDILFVRAEFGIFGKTMKWTKFTGKEIADRLNLPPLDEMTPKIYD